MNEVKSQEFQRIPMLYLEESSFLLIPFSLHANDIPLQSRLVQDRRHK